MLQSGAEQSSIGILPVERGRPVDTGWKPMLQSGAEQSSIGIPPVECGRPVDTGWKPMLRLSHCGSDSASAYRGDSLCCSEVFGGTIADAPEGTAPLDAPFCPEKAAIFPLSRAQSLSVRSQEADSAQRPSGVTATALTLSVWPSNVRIV